MGYTPFRAQASDKPYIIDMNKRASELEKANRIIRPVDEREAASDNDAALGNEAILEDALFKAKELREDANAKAMEIISKAQTEAQQILEKARQDGYNQGLEEGNMEAMRRADEYLANIQNEQDIIIEKKQEELERILKQDQEKIVDFACAVIEKFTGILVDEYKPVMLYMINQAVNDEDSSRNFNIKVCEEIYPYIQENKDKISQSVNPNINIDVFADSKLSNGQCIIETDNGIIDLSMDTKLKKLTDAIRLLAD